MKKEIWCHSHILDDTQHDESCFTNVCEKLISVPTCRFCQGLNYVHKSDAQERMAQLITESQFTSMVERISVSLEKKTCLFEHRQY
jgi:hypothetical protein